jgi:hypothetical protein
MGELLTRGAVLLETAAVRKLTEAATQDELAQADYWEIYQRLRGDMSLSKFAEKMGEYPSKAEWSRWDRGEVEARRGIRNALRKAEGLPLLPDTVAEVITQHAHPDSKVFFLGDNEVAEVVLLVGDLGLWNSAEVSTTSDAAIDAVPPRTTPQRRYYRPCLSGEIKDLVGDDDVEELIRLGKQAKQQMEGWL